MPTDPRHRRFIPAARPFAAAVRRVLRRLALDALAALRRGFLPNTSAWNQPLAQVAEPYIRNYLWMGVRLERDSLRRRRRRRPLPAPALIVPPPRPPTITVSPSPADDFDDSWIHPEVMQSARTAAYQFAESTNRTSRFQLEEARQRLGEELAQGLEEGDPVTLLSARVGRIFSRPERALTIAATESSRAMHDGRMLVARAAGVWGKEWLASEDACPLCAALDGKQIPLDEPFYVDPRGGPYAVCMAPPRHPRCRCTWNSVELKPAGVAA